ncbi:hypothetical protein KBW71_05460 [Hydrogenophaga aromaticivorans]|uniref:hypothetical protein n=1 Tax=Hydrogenophaga aromaticivorans TaxID=2610898 RepID=UPI001B3751F0|nr:hypothetical protein [Hydrogenophaga aromaticivorans]MBQ0917882.1 hypothetical protein [Hydrogenophaga aromaticivorans]
MSASDQIALLALAVSLISFWLSYRAHTAARRVSAAEKRTEAHSVLLGVLLEAQDLRHHLQSALRHANVEAPYRDRLIGIGAQLSDTVSTIEVRLKWLRSKESEDPIKLEDYKSHALEVEARIRNLAPQIKELEIPIKSFWEV